MTDFKITDLGRKVFSLATRLTGTQISATKPVSEMKTIAEVMKAVTGDRRWTADFNFGSGPYAAIKFSQNDPVGFATLYSISDLPFFTGKQEDFSEFDTYSGRSRLSVGKPNEDIGYIEMVGWLTPLNQRYQDNPAALRQLRGNELFKTSEIRVIADSKLTLLKSHFDQIQQKYREGYAMAAAGKIDLGGWCEQPRLPQAGQTGQQALGAGPQ